MRSATSPRPSAPSPSPTASRAKSSGTWMAGNMSSTMEATLIAAISVHRFAAMDIFASMLRTIKEEEALPIAEMLKRRMDWYMTIAPQVGDSELPMALDVVRKDAIEKGSKP